MRIVILAVGRLRRGPERDLVDAYAKRLSWSLREHEIAPARERSAATRLKREGELLEQAVPSGALQVVLDARGKPLRSEDFAARLGAWRDDGRRDIAFFLGGADGLDAGLKARADLLLSFGQATWPHLLARAMLVEQLYRAESILAGHPYHHGGEV